MAKVASKDEIRVATRSACEIVGVERSVKGEDKAQTKDLPKTK